MDLQKELKSIREIQRRNRLEFERKDKALNEKLIAIEEIAQREQTDDYSKFELQVIKANLRKGISIEQQKKLKRKSTH